MRLRSVLLAAVAVVLGTLAWVALLGDAPLEPEVARTLEQPPRLPRERNLFYPLAGFEAARDADAAVAGEQAVVRVNALLRADDGEMPQATAEAVTAAWVPAQAALADPEGLLCPLAEPGCIASTRATAAAIRRLADDNRWLLDRYASLADFPQFQTELLPHPATPLPRFSLLLQVHRLAAAHRLLAALDGEAGAAGALAADVAFLRRLLRQADGMLFKMVAAALLADALHAYAAALGGDAHGLEALPPIAPLDDAERDMGAALRGEFRFVAAGVRMLARGDALHRELGVPAWMGRLAIHPLFKPNRTLNREHACWRALEAPRAGGPGDAPARPAPDPCPPRWSDWLLNPVGTILSSVARPDSTRYALRLHDLAGLVTLVNAKRALRRDRVPDDGIADYLAARAGRFAGPHDGEPPGFDPGDRSLRFQSPLGESGFNRLSLEPLAPEATTP